MIEIKCDTPNTARLSEMVPFQGNLKKRTAADIEAMAQSILTEGLLMPFALWVADNDKKYILDGHGRYQALTQSALNDVSILEQDFPVLLINAATEDDARKALLQISSSYGKVTKSGLTAFTAPIVGYKCPITVKLDKVPVTAPKAQVDVIIRIKVRKDKAEELLQILKKVDGVSIY